AWTCRSWAGRRGRRCGFCPARLWEAEPQSTQGPQRRCRWSSSRSLCPALLRTHADEAGGFATQGDFESIDGVDGWITGRRAAYDDYVRVGSKAHVHEVVSNLVGQIKCLNDRRCANA